MSQPKTSNEANDLLLRQVAVPTFFQKMASDGGYSPDSDQEARQILRIGDLVKMAADDYLNAIQSSGKNKTSQAVKAASDVAFEVAGIHAAPANPGPQANEFLLDDAVKAAAAMIFDNRVKAAMPEMPTVPPALAEDEELDEDGKPKKKAVPAV